MPETATELASRSAPASRDAPGLVRGGAITLAARAVGTLLVLFTSILVARALGPEGKGVIAFLSSTAALAVRVASLGLEGSFAYFYVARRFPLADCLGVVVWTSIGLSAVATVIFHAALLLFPDAAGFPSRLAHVYFAPLPLYSILFVSTYLFFGMRREVTFSLFDVGYRAVLLAVQAVALLVLGGGIAAVVWSYVGVGGSFGILALIVAARWSGWRLPWRAELAREMLSYGSRYYLYSMFRFGLAYGAILLAQLLLGAAEAGIVSVAVAVGEILVLFGGSINLVFYPIVSSVGDPLGYTRAVATRMLGLSAVLGAGLAVVAGPVLEWLFGPPFRPAALVLLCMLPGLVLFSVEQVVSSYFASRGMPRRIVAVLGGGLVLNVVLAVPLSALLGANGVGVAAGVAQGLVAVVIVRELAASKARPGAAGTA